MDWRFFVVPVVVLFIVLWRYRVRLRAFLESVIGWARSKGQVPLIMMALLLSLIPVFPQNLITLAAATLRLRWGVPLSFCALLLRVFMCCVLAPYLFAPIEAPPVLKSWWAGYLALQITPTIGASAAGLKTIGYSTPKILLLTMPVAAVNTTLLVVCPNGIGHLVIRRKKSPSTP